MKLVIVLPHLEPDHNWPTQRLYTQRNDSSNELQFATPPYFRIKASLVANIYAPILFRSTRTYEKIHVRYIHKH